MENFLSHSAENFHRGETSSVSLISGNKKVRMRGVGVSRFSVEKFLSQRAENFRRGESFSVSIFSGIENFFASEGYVTTFNFLSKIFCLTVPKRGNPSVFLYFWVPKKNG